MKTAGEALQVMEDSETPLAGALCLLVAGMTLQVMEGSETPF